MKDYSFLFPSREEIIEIKERNAERERIKSEYKYSITPKDNMIDSASDIDSDMDTDDDRDECIPLYNNKNDYNPNIDCNYVNRRSDHTAIDCIHLSLHSRGFYNYLQTLAYEHELHMAQSDSVIWEDKRLEYIHELYSVARDFYLERHEHHTTFNNSSRSRDINNISDEEMDTCQNWVKGQYVRYKDERESALSDHIDDIVAEEGWGQCDKKRADRPYRTYLLIRDMYMARREPERCAYINYQQFYRIIELLKLPGEYDTQIEQEAYSDDMDSIMESDTDIELVESTEIDMCEYNTQIENEIYADNIDSAFETDTELDLTDSMDNMDVFTGADSQGGASSLRGTGQTRDLTRHQQYVADFKYMWQRERALRGSTPPQSCKPPSSDSGQSTPASLTRPNIQGRRRLPALPITKPGCISPPDSRGSPLLSGGDPLLVLGDDPEHELGLKTCENPSTSPATSGHQMKQTSSREWCEVSAHLTSVANDPNRKIEYYLAPIDGTPKGLGPYLAQVNRTLEKLVQRLAPVAQPKLYVAERPDAPLRVVLTPVATSNQRIIIQYLVKKSDSSTYRESGAQPTSPEESRWSDKPDTLPSEVATP